MDMAMLQLFNFAHHILHIKPFVMELRNQFGDPLLSCKLQYKKIQRFKGAWHTSFCEAQVQVKTKPVLCQVGHVGVLWELFI